MKKLYLLLLVTSVFAHASQEALKPQNKIAKKPSKQITLTKEELIYLPEFLDELDKTQSLTKPENAPDQKLKTYKKRKLSASQEVKSKCTKFDNPAVAIIAHKIPESTDSYFSDFDENNVFCFKRAQF